MNVLLPRRLVALSLFALVWHMAYSPIPRHQKDTAQVSDDNKADPHRRLQDKPNLRSHSTPHHYSSRSKSTNRRRHRRKLLWWMNDEPTGGAVALNFDADNNLWALEQFHRRIFKLNPETGQVLDTIHLDAGFIPDDFALASDGTIYWTDFTFGTIYKRPPGGTDEALYHFYSFPHVNAITLDESNNRLFFAECFGLFWKNAVHQRDLATGETMRLEGSAVPFCASNGFDVRNDALYLTRTLGGAIVRLDLNQKPPAEGSSSSTTTTTVIISSQVTLPAYAQFDSKGNLFAVGGTGELYRIDIGKSEAEGNLEVVANIEGGLASMAIDKDDRIYASTILGNNILEIVSGSTEVRIVTPQNN